jgi:hypothetical protein
MALGLPEAKPGATRMVKIPPGSNLDDDPPDDATSASWFGYSIAIDKSRLAAQGMAQSGEK